SVAQPSLGSRYLRSSGDLNMNPRQNHRENGFSLVELMVAMTITIIVMAGVIAIFVNSKKAYTNQDRIARVQENGRFAMYYLMRDIRMAGYTGCRNLIDGLALQNN